MLFDFMLIRSPLCLYTPCTFFVTSPDDGSDQYTEEENLQRARPVFFLLENEGKVPDEMVNSNTLWVVEQARKGTGGFLQYKHSFRFRNLNTGEYLATRFVDVEDSRSSGSAQGQRQVVSESSQNDDNTSKPEKEKESANDGEDQDGEAEKNDKSEHKEGFRVVGDYVTVHDREYDCTRFRISPIGRASSDIIKKKAAIQMESQGVWLSRTTEEKAVRNNKDEGAVLELFNVAKEVQFNMQSRDEAVGGLVGLECVGINKKSPEDIFTIIPVAKEIAATAWYGLSFREQFERFIDNFGCYDPSTQKKVSVPDEEYDRMTQFVQMLIYFTVETDSKSLSKALALESLPKPRTQNYITEQGLVSYIFELLARPFTKYKVDKQAKKDRGKAPDESTKLNARGFIQYDHKNYNSKDKSCGAIFQRTNKAYRLRNIGKHFPKLMSLYRHLYKLIQCTCQDSRRNELYVSHGMELIIKHLGHELGAEPCLTAMLTNNMQLLDKKVETKQILGFIKLIDTYGQKSQFIDFLGALCSCLGQAIVSNQKLICQALLSCSTNQMIDSHPDGSRAFMFRMRIRKPANGKGVEWKSSHREFEENKALWLGKKKGERKDHGGKFKRSEEKISTAAIQPVDDDSNQDSTCLPLGLELIQNGVPEVEVTWKPPRPTDQAMAEALATTGEKLAHYNATPSALFNTTASQDQNLSLPVSYDEEPSVDWILLSDLLSVLELNDNIDLEAYDSKYRSQYEHRLRLAKFLEAQLRLFAELCYDRNYICIKAMEQLCPYSLLVTAIKDTKVPVQAKGLFVSLLVNLYLNREPQIADKCPRLTRVWLMAEMDTTTLPTGSVKNPHKFALLQQLIIEHFEATKGCTVYTENGKNALTLALIEALKMLIRFGFYATISQIRTVIDPLISLFDGTNDMLSLPQDNEPVGFQPKIAIKLQDINVAHSSKIIGNASHATASAMKELGTEALHVADEMVHLEGKKLSKRITAFGEHGMHAVQDGMHAVQDGTKKAAVLAHDATEKAAATTASMAASTVSKAASGIAKAKNENDNEDEEDDSDTDDDDDDEDDDSKARRKKIDPRYRQTDLSRVVMKIKYATAEVLIYVTDLATDVKLSRAIFAFKCKRDGKKSSISRTSSSFQQIKNGEASSSDIMRANILLRLQADSTLTDKQRRRAEDFENILSCSIENSLDLDEISKAPLDDILIDLILYEDIKLVEASMRLIMANYYQRYNLIHSLAEVQLLVDSTSMNEFEIIREDMMELQFIAEKHEIWCYVDRPEYMNISQQCKRHIEHIIKLCIQRSDGSSFANTRAKMVSAARRSTDAGLSNVMGKLIGSDKQAEKVMEQAETKKFEPNKQMQMVLRNAGAVDVIGRVLAMPYPIGDKRADRNTKSIFELCHKFLRWFVYRNKENQKLLFSKHLSFLIKSMDKGHNVTKTIAEIFRDNLYLCERVPYSLILAYADKIVFEGPRSKFLDLYSVLTIVDGKPIPSNQNSILKVLMPNDEERKLRIQILYSKATSRTLVELQDGYLQRRSAMKQAAKAGLSAKLLYHIKLLSTLVQCALGDNDIAKAKLQMLYKWEDLVTAIVDDDTIHEVRIELIRYFYHGYLLAATQNCATMKRQFATFEEVKKSKKYPERRNDIWKMLKLFSKTLSEVQWHDASEDSADELHEAAKKRIDNLSSTASPSKALSHLKADVNKVTSIIRMDDETHGVAYLGGTVVSSYLTPAITKSLYQLFIDITNPSISSTVTKRSSFCLSGKPFAESLNGKMLRKCMLMCGMFNICDADVRHLASWIQACDAKEGDRTRMEKFETPPPPKSEYEPVKVRKRKWVLDSEQTNDDKGSEVRTGEKTGNTQPSEDAKFKADASDASANKSETEEGKGAGHWVEYYEDGETRIDPWASDKIQITFEQFSSWADYGLKRTKAVHAQMLKKTGTSGRLATLLDNVIARVKRPQARKEHLDYIFEVIVPTTTALFSNFFAGNCELPNEEDIASIGFAKVSLDSPEMEASILARSRFMRSFADTLADAFHSNAMHKDGNPFVNAKKRSMIAECLKAWPNDDVTAHKTHSTRSRKIALQSVGESRKSSLAKRQSAMGQSGNEIEAKEQDMGGKIASKQSEIDSQETVDKKSSLVKRLTSFGDDDSSGGIKKQSSFLSARRSNSGIDFAKMDIKEGAHKYLNSLATNPFVKQTAENEFDRIALRFVDVAEKSLQDMQLDTGEKLLPWWGVTDTSRWKGIWNGAIGVLIVWYCILVPIRISVGEGSSAFAQSDFIQSSGVFLVLDCIADGIFIMDIILSFVTIKRIDGEVCVNFKELVEHYMGHWFILDFLASIPGSLIKLSLIGGQIYANTNALGSFENANKLLRMFRILRLFRLAKLRQVFALTKPVDEMSEISRTTRPVGNIDFDQVVRKLVYFVRGHLEAETAAPCKVVLRILHKTMTTISSRKGKDSIYYYAFQDKMSKLKILPVVIEAVSKQVSHSLSLYAFNIGISILAREGANLHAQVELYTFLESDHAEDQMESGGFFSALRAEMRASCKALKHAEEIDTDMFYGMLDFLQWFCEGHYMAAQDLMRENKERVNVLAEIVQMLSVLIGDLEKIPSEHLKLATKAYDCLVEMIQGPCKPNQRLLGCETQILEISNRILRNPFTRAKHAEVHTLKNQVLRLLLALLEGRDDDNEVHKRMVGVVQLKMLQGRLSDIKHQQGVLHRSGCEEERQSILTEGFEILALIMTLAQNVPSLDDKFNVDEQPYTFFYKKMGTVEVYWKNACHRLYFPRHRLTKSLSRPQKEGLITLVNRETQESKLRDTMVRTKDLYNAMHHHHLLQEMGVAWLFNEKILHSFKKTIFTLSVMVALLLLFFYRMPTHEDVLIEDKNTPILSAAYLFGNEVTAEAAEMGMFAFGSFPSVQFGVKFLGFTIFFMTMYTLISVAVVQGPLIYLSERNFIRTALKPTVLSRIIVTTISWLAFSDHPVFTCLLLFDIVTFNDTTRNVVYAVYYPAKQLGAAALLGLIVIFTFTTIEFFFFQDDFFNKECRTMMSCLSTTLNQGLRNGGGRNLASKSTMYSLAPSHTYILLILPFSLILS